MAKRRLFKRRARYPSTGRRHDNTGRLVPRTGSRQLADKNTQSEYAMPGAGGLEVGMR